MIVFFDHARDTYQFLLGITPLRLENTRATLHTLLFQVPSNNVHKNFIDIVILLSLGTFIDFVNGYNCTFSCVLESSRCNM